MERGLVTLIGMSIAYAASFLGLGLAWWAWRRRSAGPRRGATGARQSDGLPPGDSGRGSRSEEGGA